MSSRGRWAKLGCLECSFSWQGWGMGAARSVAEVHVGATGHVVFSQDGRELDVCGPPEQRHNMDSLLMALGRKYGAEGRN